MGPGGANNEWVVGGGARRRLGDRLWRKLKIEKAGAGLWRTLLTSPFLVMRRRESIVPSSESRQLVAEQSTWRRPAIPLQKGPQERRNWASPRPTEPLHLFTNIPPTPLITPSPHPSVQPPQHGPIHVVRGSIPQNALDTHDRRRTGPRRRRNTRLRSRRRTVSRAAAPRRAVVVPAETRNTGGGRRRRPLRRRRAARGHGRRVRSGRGRGHRRLGRVVLASGAIATGDGRPSVRLLLASARRREPALVTFFRFPPPAPPAGGRRVRLGVGRVHVRR